MSGAPVGLDLETAQALAVFALLCARVAPLAWLAPWAAVRRGPWLLAPAATLVLALCLWPVARAGASVALPLAPLPLLALAAREALIGLMYALALALPVRAFEWAGAFTGRFAGGAGADAVYARLQLWLAVAAFFALGGHRVAITALADGVAARPVGVLALPSGLGGIALGSARLVAEAYALALLLALPAAAAVALAELALALAARSTSAFALSLAAAPGRAGLALLVVWMSALVALSVMPEALARGLQAAARLLQAP